MKQNEFDSLQIGDIISIHDDGGYTVLGREPQTHNYPVKYQYLLSCGWRAWNYEVWHLVRRADPYHDLRKAYAAGKTIQLRCGEKWISLDSPTFTCPPEEYRVKPEPQPVDPYQAVKDAVAAGKTIQLNIGSDTIPDWVEAIVDLDFSGKPETYRIKPEADSYRFQINDRVQTPEYAGGRTGTVIAHFGSDDYVVTFDKAFWSECHQQTITRGVWTAQYLKKIA